MAFMVADDDIPEVKRRIQLKLSMEVFENERQIPPCNRVFEGEWCSMTPVQQVVSATGSVPLLITAGDVRKMVETPEQVMEEIRLRATEIGSVLEGIFHEPHEEAEWDLTE